MRIFSWWLWFFCYTDTAEHIMTNTCDLWDGFFDFPSNPMTTKLQDFYFLFLIKIYSAHRA